jgi:hypothetical protein
MALGRVYRSDYWHIPRAMRFRMLKRELDEFEAKLREKSPAPVRIEEAEEKRDDD